MRNQECTSKRGWSNNRQQKALRTAVDGERMSSHETKPYLVLTAGEAAFDISAYSGTYGMARQPVRSLTTAPANSLEGQAFVNDNSDARYLNSSRLREFGSTMARPLGPNFKTARWDDVLDGLLVFREKRAPLFSGP